MGYEKLLNGVLMEPANGRKDRQGIRMTHHKLKDDEELKGLGMELGVHTENCLHVVAYCYA